MARSCLKLPNRIIIQAGSSQFTHFSLCPEKSRVLLSPRHKLQTAAMKLKRKKESGKVLHINASHTNTVCSFSVCASLSVCLSVCIS